MKNYIAYFRKSTDTEDKQILSLDDQKRVVHEFAKQKGLNIPRSLEFKESFSAKAPGRTVFNQVIELLKTKKANGLICYKADRLTRNYTDLGTLVELIEAETEIWATDFGQYENNANGKMVFAFNALIAKLKIDHLSEDTKRGLQMKISIGWWPGWAPLGYLNVDNLGRIAGKGYTPEKQRLLEALNRPLNRIEPDPLVSPLIRLAFELYAYEDYSLKSLCMKLHKEGLRGKYGGEISKTTLEQILKNPFYYGQMRWHKGKEPGEHEPLITKTLFDFIQEKLSGKSPIKPQYGALEFKYKGLLFCGECGCSITAERHTKKQKNGNIHHYVYYRCTKSKGGCGQTYIVESDLEPQLGQIFENFVISQGQADAIQAKLKELFIEDIRYQEKQEAHLKGRLTKLTEEKKKLFRQMVSGEVIDQEAYTEVKNDIQNEMSDIQSKLDNIKVHSEDWIQQSSNLIYLAQHARELFLEGTKEEKQTLLNCVASNLFLKDGKVEFELKKPFNLLVNVTESTDWLPG